MEAWKSSFELSKCSASGTNRIGNASVDKLQLPFRPLLHAHPSPTSPRLHRQQSEHLVNPSSSLFLPSCSSSPTQGSSCCSQARPTPSSSSLRTCSAATRADTNSSSNRATPRATQTGTNNNGIPVSLLACSDENESESQHSPSLRGADPYRIWIHTHVPCSQMLQLLVS